MCFQWGFVSAFSFLHTSTPKHTRTQVQTTHSLLIPFCLLCFTCADLSLALSLPPPSSSVSHSCAFVRSPSLSLTVSLLSRAAESASSLCPNTGRLSNTNLRRKKIRRVCACVYQGAVFQPKPLYCNTLGAQERTVPGRKRGICFILEFILLKKAGRKKYFLPLLPLSGMDSKWVAGSGHDPLFHRVIVTSSGLVVTDSALRGSDPIAEAPSHSFAQQL